MVPISGSLLGPFKYGSNFVLRNDPTGVNDDVY